MIPQEFLKRRDSILRKVIWDSPGKYRRVISGVYLVKHFGRVFVLEQVGDGTWTWNRHDYIFTRKDRFKTLSEAKRSLEDWVSESYYSAIMKPYDSDK